MGLFDSVIGAATQAAGGALGQAFGGGGDAQSPGNVLGGLGGLLEGSGGLAGLLQLFQQSGLGNVVSSWVSTGQNLPISAEQITAVLGSDVVGKFAQSLGIDPQQAAGQLSQLLPKAVDALTPDGQLPSGQPDLASMLPQVLGGLFGR